MLRIAAVFLALTLVIPAQAGWFESIYQALDFYATPSGSPVATTGDGTRVNGARSGRLRIIPSALGTGHELQLDRTFGADSRGRPELLRLGGTSELDLQGQTQMTLGYSGDKSFRTVYANGALSALNYRYLTKYGVQDLELSGVLNAAATAQFNPLGFYEVFLVARNSDSTLKLDGVVVRKEDETNFDVGPIVINGNIYVDALGALLAALGADTSGLEDLFPGSPIDRINDAIREQLQKTAVSGISATAEAGPVQLSESTLGENAAALGEPLFELTPATEVAAAGQPLRVPEPGTLLLVALGGSTVWYWQRRR